MKDIEDLEEAEVKPKKGKGKMNEKKPEEDEDVRNVLVWMQMRENLDLDKIAHKLMSGAGLNTEEILAAAGPELVQRCTGIKRVPKIIEIQHRIEKKLNAVVSRIYKREADRELYAAACPTCIAVLNDKDDQPMEMLIDGGSELNLLREDVVRQYNIPIDVKVKEERQGIIPGCWVFVIKSMWSSEE